MAAHEIEFQIEDGRIVDRIVRCREISEAACHAIWDCDCVGFHDYKVINGKPTHSKEIGGADSDRCVGITAADQCALQDAYSRYPGEERGYVTAALVYKGEDGDFEIEDL